MRENSVKLWEAVAHNQKTACKELLDVNILGKAVALPDTKLEHDWTVLHLAAYLGHRDICEILFHHATTLNIDAIDIDYKTPLHIAC